MMIRVGQRCLEVQLRVSKRAECTFILADPSDPSLQTIIGDVNLFLNDHEDNQHAEIQVMVAEESARGKGVGKERYILCFSLQSAYLRSASF